MFTQEEIKQPEYVTVPLTPAQAREFDFAYFCGRKYPKSWYQVFEVTDPDDHWSFVDEDNILFESDCMAKVHSFAYEAWKASNKTKIYTIIQAYDDSCRGGYGFTNKE